MKFLSVLAAESQQRWRRFVICAGLAAGAVLSGAIGLGFVTYAVFQALRMQYGVVAASTALAAVYLVAAGALYLLCRRASLPPVVAARQAADPLRATTQTGAAPQAAAVAMGLELAKQLTPLQLTLLAALSGFVAGRRL